MKTTWRWTDEQAASPRGPGAIGCRLLMMTASLGDSTSLIPTQLRMFGVNMKDLVEVFQSTSRLILPRDELGLSWQSDRSRLRGACSVLGGQLLKISLAVALRGVQNQLACTRLVPVLLQGGLASGVPVPAGLVELASFSICLWLTLGIGPGLGGPCIACGHLPLPTIDRDAWWVACELDVSGQRQAVPFGSEFVPEPGGLASPGHGGACLLL